MITRLGSLTTYAEPRPLVQKPLTRRQRKERSTLVLEEPATPLPPCLLAGTHVLTEAGEIPVEDLQPGDMVILAEGEFGRVAQVATAMLPAAAEAVHIRAGALGPGLPERDLTVSRDQGLFFDGVLVPACALLDGISIRFAPAAPHRFVSLALETHGVLIAEGMPVESFFDRTLPRHGRPKPCAATISEGAVLGSLRARLHARKLMVGYTILHLCALNFHFGETDVTVTVVDGAATLRIPAGVTEVVLTTPGFIPAETDPVSTDTNRRGIGISDVLINERLVPIETVFARADIYRPGPMDEFTWTRGEARLRLPPGTETLTLRVAVLPRAWRAPGAQG
jgi:hypothetical protein